jgi:hypothetical protein
MTKLHKLFLLIGLTASLSGCSKQPNEPMTAFISIPHLLKSTFYHQTGSYWIYEETATGFVDCVYVTSASFDTVPILHPGNLTPISSKESFRLTLASSFYGNEVAVYSEVDCLAASFRPTAPHHWITYEIRVNANRVLWANHLFTWPFTIGKLEPAYRFTGPSQSWQVNRILTNFEINGQTYDTAYSTITNLDLTRQAQEVHRIYVPGIGEVRRNSVNHNIDWRLIRFGLVP